MSVLSGGWMSARCEQTEVQRTEWSFRYEINGRVYWELRTAGDRPAGIYGDASTHMQEELIIAEGRSGPGCGFLKGCQNAAGRDSYEVVTH